MMPSSLLSRPFCAIGAITLGLMLSSCSSTSGGGGGGTQPAGFNQDGTVRESGGDEIDGCEVVVRPAPPGGEIPGGGAMSTESMEAYSLVQTSGNTGLDASISDSGSAQKLFTLQPGQEATLAVTNLAAGQPQLHYAYDGAQGTVAIDAVDNPFAGTVTVPSAFIRSGDLSVGRTGAVTEGMWFVEGSFAAVIALDASE